MAHPSCNEIAWYSQREGGSGIYLMDPGGAERLLVPRADANNVRNASWSPDGVVLAYTRQVGFAHDIWVVSRDDSASAKLLVAHASSPRFSPDGGWLAYVSGESGRGEVYVRRYPEGEALRVSTDGGYGAAWSPDGRALFFDGRHEGEPKMMRASIARDDGTLRVGTPTPLFGMRVLGQDGRYYRYSGSANGGRKFDVLPDGRGFVMVRMPDTPELEIVLVRNFSEELRRLSAN